MARIKEKRDYVKECLSLKDATAEDLRALSPTGRVRRIVQRMRRAGVALARDPELQSALSGRPLRELLVRAEKAIEGQEYTYE